jgi:dihydrofolate reductase
MGKIVVHEFISLDGVNEDPSSWTFGFDFDPNMGVAIGEMMGSCEAILLGRKTYKMFEPAWSKRTAEEDPGAPFMNGSPKYVVSSTLKDTTWSNSTIVPGYSAEAIRALKEKHARNLYVSGSGTLVRSMLADGLVDELRLFVYPVVLGKRSGRLFGDDGQGRRLELASTEAYRNGVVHLTYRVNE